MHNGLLTVNGEKMSKSLGNYFTIEEILQDHDPVAVRQLFLTSHYRSPGDFSREALQEAGRAAERIYETMERIAYSGINRQNTVADASLMATFREEMNDDFNTPRALALIFDEVRSLNRLLDAKKNAGLVERGSALETMCEALGLLQDDPQRFFGRKKARWLRQQGFTDDEVQKAIAARDQARVEKNWQEADRIRNELLAKGIVVEDTRGGTSWKVR
jgi:cysteinyl-tRNA synthetase